MVDKVVSISDVLSEVKRALQVDARTKNSQLVIMGPLNKNAEVASSGWIGVYVDSVRYAPRSVGAGMGNWSSDTTMRFIAQHSHMDDPEEAFRLLSELVKAIIDVVFANAMLRGLSENVPSVSVTYAARDTDQTTLYFQGALITINFIGRSQ